MERDKVKVNEKKDKGLGKRKTKVRKVSGGRDKVKVNDKKRDRKVWVRQGRTKRVEGRMRVVWAGEETLGREEVQEEGGCLRTGEESDVRKEYEGRRKGMLGWGDEKINVKGDT